jgi:collagen type IV alpha-3-binding protein
MNHVASDTLSTTSGSSLHKHTSRILQLKMSEIETYRDILNEQISTLQKYFDNFTVNGSRLESSEADLKIDEFKGEAITFRETTAAVLSSLNNCLEILSQREDSMKKKLEKEVEKRKKVEEELKKCQEEIIKSKASSIIGPDHDLEAEGPNSTIPEDEFFDAVETGLENVEELCNIRMKLKLQNQMSEPNGKDDSSDSDGEFGAANAATKHQLWPEIARVCKDQIHHAITGVDESDSNGWQLFAEEGEMKMYRREEEINGIVTDPLKSCHVVKGCTAREMCYIFFHPSFRNDWETTLEECKILEEISKDTLVFLQTHKRIWPANQRDALFWSHMRKITENIEPGAKDAWIVCNQSTEGPSYPVKHINLNHFFKFLLNLHIYLGCKSRKMHSNLFDSNFIMSNIRNRTTTR